MVGASKPFRVAEFVAAPSGSAWQPAFESAQVSGLVPPPWSVKKSLKPSWALTAIVPTCDRVRIGRARERVVHAPRARRRVGDAAQEDRQVVALLCVQLVAAGRAAGGVVAGLVAHHARRASPGRGRGSSRVSPSAGVAALPPRCRPSPTAPLPPPNGSPRVPSQCSGSVFLRPRIGIVVRGSSPPSQPMRKHSPPIRHSSWSVLRVGMAAPAREGARARGEGVVEGDVAAAHRGGRRVAADVDLGAPRGSAAAGFDTFTTDDRVLERVQHVGRRGRAAAPGDAARRRVGICWPKLPPSRDRAGRGWCRRLGTRAGGAGHAATLMVNRRLVPAAVADEGRVVAADRDAVGRRERRARGRVHRRRRELGGVRVELGWSRRRSRRSCRSSSRSR